MKNQALFSSKDKSKKFKCLLQFLFGALRVNLSRDMFLCYTATTRLFYEKRLGKLIDSGGVLPERPEPESEGRI